MHKSLRLPKPRKMAGNASLIKRGIAFIIDLLILNLLIIYPFKKYLSNLIPEFISFEESYNYILNNPEISYSIYSISIAIAILTIAYFSILELKLGQTIGKKILKLKVISTTKEQKVWQYIIRSLFLIPLFPFMLLWLLDPIYLFFNKQSQRFTESLSKTKVIQEFTWGYTQ